VRNKIIVGILVLALAISLGFNLYYYSVMVNKQVTINNMRGQIIVAWARQMSYAAYYLDNVTTNIDVHGVRYLSLSAYEIAESAWISDGTFYLEMVHAASYVCSGLGTYTEGYPISVKRINSTAVEMIKDLAQRIRDTTALILDGDIDIDLTRKEGVNPIQLLKEKGVLDEIVNRIVDIRNLAEQISDFNPKFQ
jgi:hypothetical protein